MSAAGGREEGNLHELRDIQRFAIHEAVGFRLDRESPTKVRSDLRLPQAFSNPQEQILFSLVFNPESYLKGWIVFCRRWQRVTEIVELFIPKRIFTLYV